MSRPLLWIAPRRGWLGTRFSRAVNAASDFSAFPRRSPAHHPFLRRRRSRCRGRRASCRVDSPGRVDARWRVVVEPHGAELRPGPRAEHGPVSIIREGEGRARCGLFAVAGVGPPPAEPRQLVFAQPRSPGSAARRSGVENTAGGRGGTVDAADLKSAFPWKCGFDSHRPHQATGARQASPRGDVGCLSRCATLSCGMELTYQTASVNGP